MKQYFRSFFYLLSPRGRRFIRRIFFFPLDFYFFLKGKKTYNGIVLPSPGEVFTGGGDFLENGLKYKKYFIELGGLKAKDHVLDIGSGLGRMAIPLTNYLHKKASYEGFEIVKSAVDDCSKRITKKFPNFSFRHVHIENDLYVKNGACASKFVFPFDQNNFDFAWASSVFTHLEPDAVINYLKEARRVIRPGGRFLATFFLMDQESIITSQKSKYPFKFKIHDAWYMSKISKSANVAFEEKKILQWANDAGWKKAKTFHGSWSGRKGATTDFQDIIIFS